jgi:hypothetical protein
MMPAMASAYSPLERSQVPRATPMLNVLQRVGGSIGVAVLAVALETQLHGAHSPSARAAAFGVTYWWALGLAASALLPAGVLAWHERRSRRPAVAPAEGVPATVA